jgi:hypothetical protein
VRLGRITAVESSGNDGQVGDDRTSLANQPAWGGTVEPLDGGHPGTITGVTPPVRPVSTEGRPFVDELQQRKMSG